MGKGIVEKSELSDLLREVTLFTQDEMRSDTFGRQYVRRALKDIDDNGYATREQLVGITKTLTSYWAIRDTHTQLQASISDYVSIAEAILNNNGLFNGIYGAMDDNLDLRTELKLSAAGVRMWRTTILRELPNIKDRKAYITNSAIRNVLTVLEPLLQPGTEREKVARDQWRQIVDRYVPQRAEYVAKLTDLFSQYKQLYEHNKLAAQQKFEKFLNL